MRDKKTQLIKVERVDDIPVLLHHMSTMQIAALLDQYFLTHGNWTGETTLGEVAVGWLSCIVSAGDHCLSHVESWAEEHQATLSAGLGKAIRPLDFHDDRLADILSALAQTEPWNDFETTRTGQLLRVYDLEGDRVRIDSPTGKTYAGVRPDGLFQFGHSKDHRPDLPQVKINRSALDPLGLPLTTTIVDGQSADDPLYVPEIQRVQRILGAGGKTYIGDGKMGALATRAYVAHRRDYYLCPLAGTQMPAAELEALLAPVLSGEPPLEPIYHPDTVRRKKPVLLAEGYPTSVTQTAEVDGETVTWTERRLVVRSVAYAAAQAQALDKRLAQACAEIEQLNVRKQGKARVAEEELPTAAPAILEPRGVQDLVRIRVSATKTEKKKRKYGPRPARVVSQSHGTIHAHIDPAAVAAAKARLGWRVYGTNHPRLTLRTTVLAYRGQYVIERGFGRLKGRALALTPLYLQEDQRIIGLIRLLSIALRVLTLLEFVVRRQLEKEGNPLKGLYAGNPQRATAQPTAEAILRVFRGISLVVEEADGQVIRRLTPLNPLQKRLLRLLGMPVKIYLRLTKHFQKPVPI